MGKSDAMDQEAPSIILVTGQAGAGHSTALKILEDEGFVGVDNLPLALVDQLVALEVETQGRQLAFCVDARTSGFDVLALERLIANLHQKFGKAARVLHLTASQIEIMRRFQSTRRHHPLSKEHELEEAIALDHERMTEIAPHADLVIDSTAISPNALRQAILGGLSISQTYSANIRILSFAYKQGVPETADYVFDMRFLRNPHWSAELRAMTGEAAEVSRYVSSDQNFDSFFTNLKGMARPIIDRALYDGRPQITFAFGCTGGKHRSVATAIAFQNWAQAEGHDVSISHRELLAAANQADS